MFAFLYQAVTGVFLAMYYDPSPTRAYESTRYITNEAFLGEFVRGMHKWGSTVMVVLIFLHMARTFFFGAYKYPRELNWVIGVALADPDLRHVADGLPAAVRPALRPAIRNREPVAAEHCPPTEVASAVEFEPGPALRPPIIRGVQLYHSDWPAFTG